MSILEITFQADGKHTIWYLYYVYKGNLSVIYNDKLKKLELQKSRTWRRSPPLESSHESRRFSSGVESWKSILRLSQSGSQK